MAKTSSLCVLAMIGLAVGVLSSATAEASSIGSSCAHPWTARYRAGGANGGYAGDLRHIYVAGDARLLEWTVKPGYVICSTHIDLADGRSVAPTTLLPYDTPTPIGGAYKATGRRSFVHEAIITAARSPVPPGASCDYPLESRLTSRGQGGDGTPDYDIAVVGFDPNMPVGGIQHVRIRVTRKNSHVALCPRIKILDVVLTPEEANANPPKFGTPHYYYVSIGATGGLSSEVTLPDGDLTPWVYGRLD